MKKKKKNLYQNLTSPTINALLLLLQLEIKKLTLFSVHFANIKSRSLSLDLLNCTQRVTLVIIKNNNKYHLYMHKLS